MCQVSEIGRINHAQMEPDSSDHGAGGRLFQRNGSRDKGPDSFAGGIVPDVLCGSSDRVAIFEEKFLARGGGASDLERMNAKKRQSDSVPGKAERDQLTPCVEAQGRRRYSWGEPSAENEVSCPVKWRRGGAMLTAPFF